MQNSKASGTLPIYFPWIFTPLQHRSIIALPRMVRPLLYVLPLSLLVFPLYLTRPAQYAVNWPICYALHIAVLIIYVGILVVEAYLKGPYKEFWALIETSSVDYDHKTYRYVMRRSRYLAETIMIVWTMILVATLLVNSGFLKYLRVSEGFSDPLLYAMALAVVLFGMVTGAGFGLVACMTFGVYTVSKHNLLDFKPMHPDKAGGYSCVGRYSFRTVASLSLGVLFLPTLIEFAQLGEGMPAIVIMLVVVLYTLVLAFAFAAPLVFAYHGAERALTSIMGVYSEKYEQQIIDCIAQPSEEKAISIQALDSYLERLGSINPYPFQIGTLFKMVATSILPILVFILQMVLSSDYFSTLVNQSMMQWLSL